MTPDAGPARTPASSSQGRATGVGGLPGELVAENEGAVTNRQDHGLGEDPEEDPDARGKPGHQRPTGPVCYAESIEATPPSSDTPSTVPAWQGQVLGPARLLGPGGTLGLERKAAALIAYLALEGPTHRARLTLLLWPDTRESAARNNLVQLLRKLRAQTGDEICVGGELLDLDPHFGVDARTARDLVAQGRSAEFLALDPSLLAGLSYDDCPDLDDWVTAERERFLEWHLAALREQAGAAERTGELDAALDWTRRLLDADPVSEEAHRRLMRLHYLRGDRPASLRAYHRCQEVLRREFGAEPLPETVALAREIDRGTLPVPARAVSAPPLATLRPPRLVGREAEWARMEAAWAHGQWIVIVGEPGSGKSRLAHDFAHSKGEVALLSGRPGDAEQPQASNTRGLRALLERLDTPLEPWVRRELARLLPELAPDQPPAPMGGEADLLRFRQAQAALLRAAASQVAAVIADDWQFFDAGSRRDGLFVFGSEGPLGRPGGLPRLLLTYRRGELPPEAQQDLDGLIVQDLAVRIDLDALPEREAQPLLDDLDVPPDAQVRARLWRHAGGNPLFLLETVRLLHETGQLTRGWPEQLPLPQKIRQLIGQRLSRLSARALQAARAAAVLQRDFDLELVAELLGAPLLDLAEAWEELEEAQVTQGAHFTHDLLLETVQGGTPASVRSLLHRSAARVLDRSGAGAARVAGHWLAGGKPEEAAAQFAVAAQEALALSQLVEAAQFYEQAAELYETLGQPRLAFEPLNARLALYEPMGSERTVFGVALERLADLARTPAQRAQVMLRRVELLSAQGDMTGMRDDATAGLDLARSVGDPRLEARLHEIVAVAHLKLGQMAEALPPLTALRQIGERLHDLPMQALALQGLGLAHAAENPREALTVYRDAETLGQADDLRGRVSIQNRIAHVRMLLGETRAALSGYAAALDLLRGSSGLVSVQVLALYGHATCLLALGDYAGAWQDLLAMEQADPQHRSHPASTSQLGRVLALRGLGRADLAAQVAQAALDSPLFQRNLRPRAHSVLGTVLADMGRPDEARAAFDQAEAALAERPSLWPWCELLARRAVVLAPEDRLRDAETLLERSERLGLASLHATALVRRAEALAALGGPTDLPPAPDAGGDLILDPAERHLARATVARALGQDPAPHLEAARTWVRHTLSTLPAEFRASFAQRFGALEPLEP